MSSAVWIGADRESVLSVSGGQDCPIEADKIDSLSAPLHTSAHDMVRAGLSDGPL